MKTGIAIGGAASGKKDDFDEVVNFAVEAEKLGVDMGWSAEACSNEPSSIADGRSRESPRCVLPQDGPSARARKRTVASQCVCAPPPIRDADASLTRRLSRVGSTESRMGGTSRANGKSRFTRSRNFSARFEVKVVLKEILG